jgi:phosphatidylserine decarboxylase
LMALPVARYGRGEMVAATVGLVLLAAAVYVAVPWAALIPLLLLAFFFWFFRDPERRIPSDPGVIVAPADGTISDLTICDESRFLQSQALRIGIFLSVFDVHVNRAPVGGRVAYLEYRRGRFLNALRFEACARENESNSVGLQTGAVPGGKILVRQIAGALAQRIVCGCRLGGDLIRGERFGMIKFGSRTELYVPDPVSLEICVKVGDHVKGGETVLAVVKSRGGNGS